MSASSPVNAPATAIETAAKPAFKTEVLIVGAGPVGLTLANYLGGYGVRTLIIESLPQLIDYPRAIGIDDEAMRTMQGVGLADKIEPHTTPLHWMRFLTASGRCWASIEPRTDEFGWSRRNAFIQPQADRILYEGLSRFPHVEIRFATRFVTQEQNGERVLATLEGPDGHYTVEADYVVGADGGRSPVRESLGLAFEGATAANQWIVIDVENDPISTPNLYLVCDPKRPYVSAALPHGVRRFEFMVMKDETEEHFSRPEVMRALLSKVIEKPEEAKLIRQRVYNHNARLASRFRVGRVLLAGDAAHIMPVWQGQGYNSGIRDAANLGWKLAMVVKGQLGPGLLDTYQSERRDHARKMIDLSVMVGKVFNPPYPFLNTVRDAVTRVLNLVPSVKRYLLEMRFKPMPRFTEGVVVPSHAGDPKTSPVGRLFIQPRVRRATGEVVRMDEVIGPNFAIIAWGSNPIQYMEPDQVAMWRSLGAVFISVKPDVQLGSRPDEALGFRTDPLTGVVEIGDTQGRLKDWFGNWPESVVFLRPDRVVAATSSPLRVTDVSRALAHVMAYTAKPAQAETQGTAVAAE
ncbi:bifunctional 3-(3-hydroxy-phenyl)propionate/3-hydroxycinnamic acid hydroxylase [Allorhizobium borbori]|uniref:3-(3-hydroxy-phenyl)propionate hydroxylase n=1 Tax=Allorhizobium borbori TaxID=485907 RepID=A0A7W6JZ66_9HYPH|nr:bifunctional 3-(3-hydroxy-phenyl)propionate/3-hydroxycinnamic acid hydroxylase [Allorhizobium borbori]MBB4102224.1 3-(3-hydroxy-phenyl)propionate hydroxylase [Allorhizobium borbori]